MKKPTQLQLYYAKQRKIAEQNRLFLSFVDDGITRQDLQKNIDRNPAVWSKYSAYLDILPEENHDL